MRRNVEAALRYRERARRKMPWLDTPDYVLRASDGELVCVSEPYKDCSSLRGVFVFRNGEYFQHFNSVGEYDTSKMQKLEDYARERGLV